MTASKPSRPLLPGTAPASTSLSSIQILTFMIRSQWNGRMATRFQGDRQMVVMDKTPGSSLDPSAEPGHHDTTRVGFDLTTPLEAQRQGFRQSAFPEVDLSSLDQQMSNRPIINTGRPAAWSNEKSKG